MLISDVQRDLIQIPPNSDLRRFLPCAPLISNIGKDAGAVTIFCSTTTHPGGQLALCYVCPTSPMPEYDPEVADIRFKQFEEERFASGDFIFKFG